jgi:hypothetical protein
MIVEAEKRNKGFTCPATPENKKPPAVVATGGVLQKQQAS